MALETVLYKNARHGISKWSICQADEHIIVIKSEAKIGDTPLVFTEEVEKNHSGRSLQQQVELRINARIRSKLDNGYVRNKEDADRPLTNQMGLLQPMLAQSFEDLKIFKPEEYYAQMKLDGHRCLITNFGGDLVAYSRRGKPINTVTHILKGLEGKIPDGWTLDGELYVHGIPLQTIASWAKRKQPKSQDLQYVCYDLIDDAPYQERFRMLSSMGLGSSPVRVLEAMRLNRSDVIKPVLMDAISKGYEGLILRHKEGQYEIGRRSKNLIKVKHFQDDEAVVVGVLPSKDEWAILVCDYKGKQFKMSAPGTVGEKRAVLVAPNLYIGRTVTFEYAQLTKEGVPFHASALRWRTDL